MPRKEGRVQDIHPADREGNISAVRASLLHIPDAGALYAERSLPGSSFAAGILLFVLPVHVQSGRVLRDLLDRRLFPGSLADHFNHYTDPGVDDADHVEYRQYERENAGLADYGL